MTVTLGIDLSSQPNKTGVCILDWRSGTADVLGLWRGVDGAKARLDDAQLMALMLGTREFEVPSKIAIDAPLGWPVAFVRALTDLEHWPVPIGEPRSSLERRATDHWVHDHADKQPLSVSTDRIAYPAMRAAGLLAHYTAETGIAIDRSGVSGPVCETYPDPAIRELGLWTAAKRASYKGAGDAARSIRSGVVASLTTAAPWLRMSDADRSSCVAWDDCLDALVCALVARATALGRTVGPPAEHLETARAEGWIHLPEHGALEELLRPS